MSEVTVRKRVEEEVALEFPHVGRYRVRLLRKGSRAKHAMLLDIREYVEAESFTGFTRRGVRLQTRQEAAALRDILAQVERDGALPAEDRQEAGDKRQEEGGK